MIEIVTESFAEIECLHAAPAGRRGVPLPTVVFYHGFTSSKEVYSYFAVALAQAGFRVVMPDAEQHGSRYHGDAEYLLGHFWEILRQNIDELPSLEAALRQAGLVEAARFAVAGASMGGMTALGIMARNPQVKSVACLMGSGYFSTLSQTLFPPFVAQTADRAARLAPLADYDVSHQLAKLADRPLLLWHGDADDVVPAAETLRLEQALRAASLDSNLTFLTEAGVGHRITPPALSAVVTFFTHHL
ncbi:esterase [Erwinia sp. V71]|uniref:esterase n=1 Tax=Erwinia sp. V71 TaxID=3369424 RepID=UPI003F610072